MIVPVTLILVFSAISPLLLWPYHIVNMLYSLWCYRLLGPNTKFLLFILCPIPIALYPVVMVCGTIIACVCLGFLYPFGATFVRYEQGFDAIEIAYEIARKEICSFNSELADKMWHIRSHRLGFDQKPWDLNLCMIPIGLIMAVLGIAVVTPVNTVLLTLKLVPGIFRSWCLCIRLYCDARDSFILCCCFPFFLVSFALAPAGVVLLYAGGIVASVVAGAVTPVYGMLEEDDLCEGFRQMYECIRECDKTTNEFLLGDNDTCFPKVQRRAPTAPLLVEDKQKASLKVGHEVLNAKQKADRKTIAHVWDNYFASAVFHTLQLRAHKAESKCGCPEVDFSEKTGSVQTPSKTTLTYAQVESKVAGVTLFSMLVRSVDEYREVLSGCCVEILNKDVSTIVAQYMQGTPRTFVFHDGMRLGEDQMPDGPEAIMLWQPALELFDTLRKLQLDSSTVLRADKNCCAYQKMVLYLLLKGDEVTDSTLLPSINTTLDVKSQSDDLQCTACTFLNPPSRRGKKCEICEQTLTRRIFFKDVVTWQDFFNSIDNLGNKIATFGIPLGHRRKLKAAFTSQGLFNAKHEDPKLAN